MSMPQIDIQDGRKIKIFPKNFNKSKFFWTILQKANFSELPKNFFKKNILPKIFSIFVFRGNIQEVPLYRGFTVVPNILLPIFRSDDFFQKFSTEKSGVS
jgi:hypothetical protein